jgi:5-formyltetrahydrofolate cyclo-ligase
LAKCRPDCLKLGLSFFEPIPAISDTGDHDMTLDHCITPDSVFSFSEA